MTALFTVLDDSNTAVVTLSDPRPTHFHTRKVCTLADKRSISNAILRYARERRIDPRAVEYAVTWPSAAQSKGVTA